jgi:hypothetical protein
MFSENDAGGITGNVYLASPETSDDFRLRVGLDTILFQDSFNATNQNTANWKHVFTTQTMVQASGFLVTNNNLTATTTTGSISRSSSTESASPRDFLTENTSAPKANI